ncbi:MAG: acyl-CoA/acyl-ACP dehydrogenase [Pseudomonadales bacterium]|nr:acyl-CoA/acyl-ACP dehydrogenase [Pseudomonadales bacterium]
MNFEFSEEQNMLRDQAVSFLKDKSPLSVARKILEGNEPYDKALWKDITDLGWTATTIPEKYNGLGLSHLELCVLAEELGRALTPVPFSSSLYLATEAILAFGTDAQKEAWLGKLAQGQVIGTAAVAEGPGEFSPTKVGASVKANRLSGTKIMVPDGDIADFAVVVAGGDAGLSLFLVDLNQPGVTRTSVATIDPSRSHANLAFKDAEAEPLGKAGEGASLLSQLFDRAAVLFAFEQVGGAEAAMNQAREYALGRYAFGRPIAGFQAIKHKLARMYVAIQLARSNCYYGAWALSSGAPELPVAAATARVSASQAYRECAEENIQVHGGMGFTWEFDCHLFYRRAKLLAVNLGGESTWKNRLISSIESDRAA